MSVKKFNTEFALFMQGKPNLSEEDEMELHHIMAVKE